MVIYAILGSVVRSFYFTILFMSMFVQMGFKLFLEQATELRRAHSVRPPPKPDPPSKKKLQTIKKAHLAGLRQGWYDRRLLHKQRGRSSQNKGWFSYLNIWSHLWVILDSISHQDEGSINTLPILDLNKTRARSQYVPTCEFSPMWWIITCFVSILSEVVASSLCWVSVLLGFNVADCILC